MPNCSHAVQCFQSSKCRFAAAPAAADAHNAAALCVVLQQQGSCLHASQTVTVETNIPNRGGTFLLRSSHAHKHTLLPMFSTSLRMLITALLQFHVSPRLAMIGHSCMLHSTANPTRQLGTRFLTTSTAAKPYTYNRPATPPTSHVSLFHTAHPLHFCWNTSMRSITAQDIWSRHHRSSKTVARHSINGTTSLRCRCSRCMVTKHHQGWVSSMCSTISSEC